MRAFVAYSASRLGHDLEGGYGYGGQPAAGWSVVPVQPGDAAAVIADPIPQAISGGLLATGAVLTASGAHGVMKRRTSKSRPP